jgi:methyl-accepting chemotaxis protein
VKIRSKITLIVLLAVSITSALVISNFIFLKILSRMQDRGIAAGQKEEAASQVAGMGDMLYSVWADAIINRSMAQNQKDWTDLYQKAEQAVNQIKGIVTTDEEQQLYTQAAEGLEKFDYTYRMLLVPLCTETNEINDDMMLLDTTVDEYRNQIRSSMTAFDDLLKKQVLSGDVEFDSKVTALLTLGFILSITGILSIILISLKLIRSITTPLGRQIKLLSDLAEGEGDLTVRLEEHARDELGTIGGEFNSFLKKLTSILTIIRQGIGRVDDGSAELTGHTAETAASLSQITANVETLNNSLIEQSASITETSASVEEINKNVISFTRTIERQNIEIEQTTERITAVSRELEELESHVREASSSYETLHERSSDGQQKIGDVIQLVQTIGEKSEYLLETNRVVASIAGQTSLLAMNAAIEAAHAGQAGQGFAVVADEIRKLSESSTRQAKDIAGAIKEIKSLIDRIQEASANSEQAFDLIASQISVAGELQTKIAQMLNGQVENNRRTIEAFTTIQTVSAEIKSGSDEMTTGTQSIQEEMLRLVHQSTSAQQAVAEVKAGTDEIQAAVQAIVTLAETNKEAVNQVRAETDRFKLS